QDQVTTVGSGTDSAVRRIVTGYEKRGMVSTITSYDGPTAGTALNQVEMDYNGFGQLTDQWQEHNGTVSSSPEVIYSYDGGGSSNEARPSAMRYPDGRVIDFNYGASTTLDYKMNRVTAIKDG